MSKRSHHAAVQEIRSWTTEHVQKVLANHGLGDCCEAVRKREVDGDMLLTLTEGQLALWKRDLSLSTIKKLARFVEDVAAQPEKYVHQPELQADTNRVVEHKSLPAVTRLVSSHSGRSSPLSDSASWDTDFSDDQALSPRPTTDVETDVEYMNSDGMPEKPPQGSQMSFDVQYCNNAPVELPEKPQVPTRPPNLSACNLPKPPVPLESSCYGHVKSLVSNLNLQDPSDQFDEEEYESLEDGVLPSDLLASMLKKSLKEREQATWSTVPRRVNVNLMSEQNTFPRAAGKLKAASPQLDNEGYMSDEYESIKEGDKPPVLPPAEGAEYYLQPLTPALPGKPSKKPADPGVPSSKPPSPPRRKSDDSSSSPGNSGDGVVGLFGDLFRKLRGPDFRERTATLETKKTATVPTVSQNKVEQRPVTFQTNQRPLPPTPQDKKPTSAVARRPSKTGLTQQPWYHNVDRTRGEELLKNGEDGSFLVRPSKHAENAHTLTLWYNDRLYNIGIRLRLDGRYALGTVKTNEQSFTSVEELVQNYRSEKLVLYSGGEKAGRTLLTSSPAQDSQPSAL